MMRLSLPVLHVMYFHFCDIMTFLDDSLQSYISRFLKKMTENDQSNLELPALFREVSAILLVLTLAPGFHVS